MKSRNLMLLTVAGAMMLGSLSTAYAGDIRLRCEVRADRSKISVDGKNLVPGRYRAVVISGSQARNAGFAWTDGDEVEFDFSSQGDDVAEGAVRIPVNFIQRGRVTGRILDDRGFLTATDTVSCRVRRR